VLRTSCLRFLTKRPAIPQQIYKTTTRGLSAIAELLVRRDMAILRFAVWQLSASVILNYRNLKFMSRYLYRHAILPLCAKFHWNRTIGCWVVAKKTSAILNFKSFHIWLRDSDRVPNLLLCTEFHRNRVTFRWDMAIWRFSRWRMSAILNFRGTIMGFLKSPCRTCRQ